MLDRSENVTDPNADMSVISNLTPGTLYMVRLAGRNSRGLGRFSDFEQAQTWRGWIIIFFDLRMLKGKEKDTYSLLHRTSKKCA